MMPVQLQIFNTTEIFKQYNADLAFLAYTVVCLMIDSFKNKVLE